MKQQDTILEKVDSKRTKLIRCTELLEVKTKGYSLFLIYTLIHWYIATFSHFTFVTSSGALH